MLVIAKGLTTQAIDRLARRGGGEPPPGVGRDAVPGPFLQRGDVGLGRRVLGDVEIAEAACQAGDDRRPRLAVGEGDGLFYACRVMAPSIA